jgi:hypothetical protein
MLRENAPVQWAGFSLAAGRRYRIELGQRTFGGHIAADARWGCEEGLPGADPSGAQWYREEFETGAAGRLDLGLDHSGGSPLVSLTVNVEDAGPATDTVPSDAAGAPVIAQGAGVRQGVVDYVGDADTFRVSLREGVRYRIEAQALAGATNPINVRLAESPTDALGFVRTESGPVGVGRPGPWNGRDGITQRSGDHFVVVYSDFQAVGGYRFRVYPSGCRPDWNDDGATTVDDLLTFLTDWLAGEGEYDGIGFDGGTIDDLLLFVQEWIAGC